VTPTSDGKLWDLVLDRLREDLEAEEFRRWFSDTSQASDAGDQVTVWVSSQPVVRHITLHYQRLIDRALADLDRPDVDIRFVAAGHDEEE
jgi:chromosomal replication initiation ATPase DnaA